MIYGWKNSPYWRKYYDEKSKDRLQKRMAQIDFNHANEIRNLEKYFMERSSAYQIQLCKSK